MKEFTKFEDLYEDLIRMGTARVLARLNDNHNLIDMRGSGAIALANDGEVIKEDIISIRLTDTGLEIFSIPEVKCHLMQGKSDDVSDIYLKSDNVSDEYLMHDESYRRLKGNYYELTTLREILSVLEK